MPQAGCLAFIIAIAIFGPVKGVAVVIALMIIGAILGSLGSFETKQ
jgi:hypothetical protein